MRNHDDSPSMIIHPHVYWIVGLSSALAILVFTTPPSSLLIIFVAAVLVVLIHYFAVSIFFSKKTTVFSACIVWGSIFLHSMSALNGLNVLVFCALVLALGIYLYR